MYSADVLLFIGLRMVAIEHILLAEAELQKAMSRINLDVSSTKEEFEVFEPLDGDGHGTVKLDVAREELKKADLSASDYERRVRFRRSYF